MANGSDGLVVAGTTGEAPVLSDPERLALIEAVAQAVTVPVLAGTTTNDTEHSIGLTRQAEALGAAGVLAVTPYYNRPSQAGLLGHFSAVAEATSLPVVLYDIPVRTGRKILSSTVLSLVGSHANVVGVKEASGDLAGAAELIAAAPEGFEVYSGDDVLPCRCCRWARWASSRWRRTGSAPSCAPASTPSWPATCVGPPSSTRRCSARSASRAPIAGRTRCRARPSSGLRASRSASAAGPWARPMTSSRPLPRPCSKSSTCSVASAPSDVRVIFLGGLGEIGRNCACLEIDGRLLVIDVGIMFPEPDMPGVDLVLPDLTFLRETRTGSTGSS